MLLRRTTSALCLIALCAASPAFAQNQAPPGGFSQAPQGGSFVRPSTGSPWDNAPGSPPAGPSPFDQPAHPQEPPCIKDFIPLRDDAQKKAQAVRAASKRHATPQEACKLFNALIAAQEKLGKFAAANVAGCGIPKEVPTQIHEAIKQTDGIRTKVCEVAARGPVSSGPSLSDALGSGPIANPTNVKRGGGTFDTLSGNVLAR